MRALTLVGENLIIASTDAKTVEVDVRGTRCRPPTQYRPPIGPA
jgi:hypothetical protein